jgi:hypothetical protein
LAEQIGCTAILTLLWKIGGVRVTKEEQASKVAVAEYEGLTEEP